MLTSRCMLNGIKEGRGRRGGEEGGKGKGDGDGEGLKEGEGGEGE